MIAFYYLLRIQADKIVNDSLEKQKSWIVSRLDPQDIVASGSNGAGNDALIIAAPENLNLGQKFSDTSLYDPLEKRIVLCRKLHSVELIGNQKFVVEVYKSLTETDDLVIRVLFLITGLIFVIIISLLLMNRYSSLKSWKVFYNTIEKINKYNINSNESFELQRSDVREFDELNKVLQTMAERIRKDYVNLKEYTENASHEIQTPLAVIMSKMELLLQSENLSEKQYKTVSDAYEASARLSKLNKTLILLAKIDNRQFPEAVPVNPRELIERQLEHLEDEINQKEIIVELNEHAPSLIHMDKYLADILFANLIKNAVIHNIRGGKLNISIDQNSIEIINSGNQPDIEPQKAFERYSKTSKVSGSMGLGLAIVQKICDAYGFVISYQFSSGTHTVKFDCSTRS